MIDRTKIALIAAAVLVLAFAAITHRYEIRVVGSNSVVRLDRWTGTMRACTQGACYDMAVQ
jgi:hypothetical protein